MSTVLDVAAPPAASGFDPETFRARRERFLEAAGDGVAILCAAHERTKSRDTEMKFRQDSDFWYLTGFPEPDAVAVLTPHDDTHRLTLFVRPRDPERETWTGRRHGVDGARDTFGADAAYPLDELPAKLRELVAPADALWYGLGMDAEMDRRVVELLKGFRGTRPRGGKGPWDVRDPAQVLDEMRLVKEPAEIEAIRAAARLAERGHRAVMAAARPGVGEWELEAVMENTFRRAGAWGASFGSIVGAGVNGTVLHYVTNDATVRDGELVLVDAGAELGMYCSDITRTFPANGRFTDAQREVYEIVLAAEEAGIAAVQPGAPFSGIHDAALRVLVEGMRTLGLVEGGVEEIIEEGTYKRFYMHQTSHWLGLDVHDAGPYRLRDGGWIALRPGMVLTVEPGLYIPDDDDVPEAYRGIAVRIEDDVLVTEDGHELLTRGVPVAPHQVEAIVGGAA
jgi:Xaa-Pro aminopeptidase